MATSNTTVSMKLLIDSKRQKVLFAEAGKDFVDFLFTLLSMPLGTVIKLLSKEHMVGSFGNLYKSVENLDDTYMQAALDKDLLLKPKASVAAGPKILGLLTDVESTARKPIYMCSSSSSSSSNLHRYVAEDPKEKCPSCRHTMSAEATFVGQQSTTSTAVTSASVFGFVKGVVTYMVMDDLEVKPMSTISSIALLNRFNVKDVGTLEEKVVGLGMDQVRAYFGVDD